MNAGQEVTEEFTAIHSRKAWALLDKYAIGTLKTDGGPSIEACFISFIGESHDGHSSAQNPLKISPAPVVLPRLRMVF